MGRAKKASHRISSILDLDQLIDRIVNEIACSFGLVEANVYLYEPDRDELVREARGDALEHEIEAAQRARQVRMERHAVHAICRLYRSRKAAQTKTHCYNVGADRDRW